MNVSTACGKDECSFLESDLNNLLRRGLKARKTEQYAYRSPVTCPVCLEGTGRKPRRDIDHSIEIVRSFPSYIRIIQYRVM
jgi:hypothetical protein